MSQMRSWLLVLGTCLLFGCGSDFPDPQTGPMPDGGDYTGVYFSPQYGEMHIIQNGNSVRGEYTKDERMGKITGEVQGDLLQFEWVEEKAMIANRPTETRGRGYFNYKVDPANEEHVIKGRWGLGDDDREGGEWNAYKAKSREPQLTEEDSSGGDGGDDDGDFYEEDLDSGEDGGDSADAEEEEDELGF